MSKDRANVTVLDAKTINESNLTQEIKDLLIQIQEGKKVIPLTTDIMSKCILSPDLHPDRFDFLVQHVMNDKTLITNKSATNEPPLESFISKKLITDIPAWMKDSRLANAEMQVVAQEFIFNRVELLSSRMLMLQYSIESQPKSSIDYENVPGIVLIVLMKESPKNFKAFKSSRYIHRITKATTDTGLDFPMLRQIAFVELDKALEQFIHRTYNEDEDLELLTFLAALADINNKQVQAALKTSDLISNIYDDAALLSQNKEAQLMLFGEELEIMDWNSGLNHARKEGEDHLNSMYLWLNKSGRTDDLTKALSDKEYRKRLFDEYDSLLNNK